MKSPLGDVAAVIVTYNSAGCLGQCLKAATTRCDEVLVVDNASSDDTVDVARRFPVRVLANQSNRGFAAAVNQGFRETKAELVLVLNPDVIVGSSLDPLVEAARPASVGAASGVLLGSDGQPQSGFMVRRFPTVAALGLEALGCNRLWRGNPVNRRYRCQDLDLNRAQAVEQPAGACLLVKKTAWERVGGFDERFHPLWFEDVDFLLRLNQAGYKVWFDPSFTARHAGGHSVRALSTGERQEYWYGNLLKFAAKHFTPLPVRALAAAVMIGIVARRVLGLVAGRKRLEVGRQYGKVLRLAGSYFLMGKMRP